MSTLPASHGAMRGDALRNHRRGVPAAQRSAAGACIRGPWIARLRAVSAVGVLLAATADAAAGLHERISIAPAPAWVEPPAVPIPTNDLGSTTRPGTPSAAPSLADDDRRGIEWLLYERQVNRTVAPPETYVHRAWRLRDPSGVQDGSRFSAEFDPRHDELVLHSLRIHRGGEVLDRLRPDAIRVIQREEELEAQVYDGTLTALVLFEDVRPGDVIETSFTRRGDTPGLVGRYVDHPQVAFHSPIASFQFRLLWPAARPLAIRANGQVAVAPTSERRGDIVEHVWRQSPAPVLRPEDALPSWYLPFPWIQLSNFEDWGDVARWAAPLYRHDAPAPPPVRRVIDGIASAHPDTASRALAAFRFVQSDLRYLAIDLGVGGYQPAPPDVVLERRFGDCKDKSSLLVALLRGLGVPAQVALVSTELRGHVREWHPSPTAFDHVIVRAHLDDRWIWLDPTDGFARGELAATSLPDYGVALVVADETTDLVDVSPNPGARHGRAIEAVFEVSESTPSAPPTSLTVTTRSLGRDADGARAGFAGSTLEEMAADARDFYARTYPTIEIAAPMTVTDDERANEIVAVERYRIGRMWQDGEGGDRSAELVPCEIAAALDPIRHQRRTMPLAVGHPTRISYLVRVTGSRDWSIDPEDETIRNAGLSFRRTVRTSSKALEIDYAFETLADHVAPAESARYIEDLERIGELVTFTLVTSDDSLAAMAPLFVGVGFGLMVMVCVGLVSVVATLLLAKPSAPGEPRTLRGGLWVAPLTVWARPRTTMRSAFAGSRAPLEAMALVMSILAGTARMTDRASSASRGDTMGLSEIVAMAVVGGMAYGLLRLYLGGWLLAALGRLLGGVGTAERVRGALGMNALALTIGGLMLVPCVAFLGHELFTTETPVLDQSPWLMGLLGAAGAIQALGTIWSIVILVRCLAEAHGFSAWRALGTVVLAVVIVVGVALAVAGVFFGFGLALSR